MNWEVYVPTFLIVEVVWNIPLPELKVNGPGGYMRTAESSDSEIN